MIKVNFKDGTTLAFDLTKASDVQQWDEWSNVKDFQERITGIGVLHNKKFHTFTLPRKFRKVRFYAELVHSEKRGERKLLGERLVCHADEIKLSLMVYTCQDPPPPVLSRMDVERVGKQMFSNSAYEAVKGA